jgi:hypothetical protein
MLTLLLQPPVQERMPFFREIEEMLKVKELAY